MSQRAGETHIFLTALWSVFGNAESGFVQFATFCIFSLFLLSNSHSQPIAHDVSSASIVDKLSADRHDRMASLRRIGDSKYFDYTHPKFRTYDILAATASKGCGPADWSEYMARFPTMDEGGKPLEFFGLPPVVRYLYQFGSCLSDSQKKRLLAGLTRQPQSVLGHGTLNHAAMQSTSWYLLAQYFPEARWPSLGDGKTYSSKDLMAILKANLMARTKRFYQSGQYEWLAPTYAGINVFPMLNLYDFAEDPEVKQLASDEATLEVAVLRAHSFHGLLVPPLTRVNAGQTYDRSQRNTYSPALAQHLLWTYFGEPVNPPLEEFQSRRDPFFAVMFALSNWRPPEAVSNLDPAKQGNYTIRLVTPGFSQWGAASQPELFGDTWITPDYAIGTGNAVFEPGGGYSGHLQTFAIMLNKSPPNQIECVHPYFNGDDGEDAWGADRWSPFQQTYRYDDTSVVMLFKIPKVDPWPATGGNPYGQSRINRRNALHQMFQCRIPREVDQMVSEDHWIFARQADVFVAIGTLKGTNEYDDAPRGLTSKFKIMKVRETNSALYIRVEKARPGYGFDKFRDSVKSRTPVFDEKTSMVEFLDGKGVKTAVRFDLSPDADGKHIRSIPQVVRGGQAISLVGGAPIEAPFISLRGGALHLDVGDAHLNIKH